MGELFDLEIERAKRELCCGGAANADQNVYGVPQCKLVRDFLAIHHLSWQVLYLPLKDPHPKIVEFHDVLAAFFNAIEAERKRLCDVYSVLSENDLPPDTRDAFNVELRAFIAKEDHYP